MRVTPNPGFFIELISIYLQPSKKKRFLSVPPNSTYLKWFFTSLGG